MTAKKFDREKLCTLEHDIRQTKRGDVPEHVCDSQGSIFVPEGIEIPAHELATANRMKQLGYHVEFNSIVNALNVKNPDATINGEMWEFKGPTGSGRSTISNQFARARKQASNVVIDLARSSLPTAVALQEIARRLHGQKRITRLIVFDRNGHMTEFNR